MQIGKTFTLITGFKTLSCTTSFIIYFLWNVEEEKRNKLKRFSSIIFYSIALQHMVLLHTQQTTT